MSRCANGTSKSFSCARFSQAERTKVTVSRSRASPDCQKKFSIELRRFSRSWKNQMERLNHRCPENRDEKESQPQAPISRRWTCCKATQVGHADYPAAANAYFRFLTCGSQTGAPWGMTCRQRLSKRQRPASRANSNAPQNSLSVMPRLISTKRGSVSALCAG